MCQRGPHVYSSSKFSYFVLNEHQLVWREARVLYDALEIQERP